MNHSIKKKNKKAVNDGYFSYSNNSRKISNKDFVVFVPEDKFFSGFNIIRGQTKTIANIIINADIIKRHSLNFYKLLYNIVLKEKQSPWIIERLWNKIFKI